MKESTLAAFFVPLHAVKSDGALHPGGKGYRKLIVKTLRNEHEVEAMTEHWQPPHAEQPCQVRKKDNVEIAIFNHRARQDRHFHTAATEIYCVFEGAMAIEIAERKYYLAEGDMIVVDPGAIHQVSSAGADFLCRVMTVRHTENDEKVVVV